MKLRYSHILAAFAHFKLVQGIGTSLRTNNDSGFDRTDALILENNSSIASSKYRQLTEEKEISQKLLTITNQIRRNAGLNSLKTSNYGTNKAIYNSKAMAGKLRKKGSDSSSDYGCYSFPFRSVVATASSPTELYRRWKDEPLENLNKNDISMIEALSEKDVHFTGIGVVKDGSAYHVTQILCNSNFVGKLYLRYKTQEKVENAIKNQVYKIEGNMRRRNNLNKLEPSETFDQLAKEAANHAAVAAVDQSATEGELSVSSIDFSGKCKGLKKSISSVKTFTGNAHRSAQEIIQEWNSMSQGTITTGSYISTGLGITAMNDSRIFVNQIFCQKNISNAIDNDIQRTTKAVQLKRDLWKEINIYRPGDDELAKLQKSELFEDKAQAWADRLSSERGEFPIDPSFSTEICNRPGYAIGRQIITVTSSVTPTPTALGVIKDQKVKTFLDKSKVRYWGIGVADLGDGNFVVVQNFCTSNLND